MKTSTPVPEAPAAIDLNLAGPVGQAINAALQADIVKVALSSFMEGRGLEGQYRLQISGAKLVPSPKAGE